MSSFNFDPFASAPPPPSGAGGSNNAAAPPANASGGVPPPISASAPPSAAAPAIVNPFDNFGFVQPRANNNNNAQPNNGSVWKNMSSKLQLAAGGGLPPPPPSSSSLHSNSSSTQQQHKKRFTKRIVPYNSPISTLESNWDPWLFVAQQQQSQSSQSLWNKNGGNHTTYLVVRANEGCRLTGGVESVLKWASKQRSGSGMGEVGDMVGNFDSSLSLNEGVGGGGATDVDSNNNKKNGPNDNTNNAVGRQQLKAPSSGGLGGGSMRFLKSGLKKAQASIERSVTTMAIKADGGKNSDQLCVSLHYCGGLNGQSVNLNMWNALGMNANGVVGQGVQQDVADVCLSRTEWVELPSSVAAAIDGGDDGDGEGLLFSIPLSVPDLSFLEASAAGQGSSSTNNNCVGGVQLTVRLYLRSGAMLLKAVANREYCIGESALLYSNLMQLVNGPVQQQQQQYTNNGNGGGGGGLRCGTINVPFTTGMLAETSSFSNSFHSSSHSSTSGDAPAALHITATPRVKFNPTCTYGWSLTDPVTTPPLGPSSWLKMFQLPLDQGYVFNILHHHLHHHRLLNSSSSSNNHHQQMAMAPSNSAVILANERAVESALTLPLATACSRLFSVAATQSQQLALAAATGVRQKDPAYLPSHEDVPRSYPPNAVIETALVDGRVHVEFGVVALVLLGDEANLDNLVGFGNACGGIMESVPSVKTSLTFQSPHSIFEEVLVSGGSCPLLDEQSGAEYINGSPSAAGMGPNGEAITTEFCPRIYSGLDELLPGVAGTKPNGKYVGSIRLEVLVGYANSSAVDTISTGISGGTAVEGLVELENYMDDARMQQSGGKVPVLAPAIDANTGRRIGTFVLLLRVTGGNFNPIPLKQTSSAPAASSGLVSVVGLDTLTEESGLAPYIDCDAPPPNSQLVASPAAIRRRQVATMGSFVTSQYLFLQVSVRRREVSALSERYDKYYKSILSGLSIAEVGGVEEDNEMDVPLFKRRMPRPFRPSNSRGDALLAGIGFNVHVQSLSLNILQDANPPLQAAVTQSVTHGAPADHAKGFGGQGNENNGKGDSTKDAAPRGGLRRLEGKRLEFAKELDDSISGLVSAVGDHFKSRAQVTAMRQQAGIKTSRHIPPNLPAITHYRTKAMDCAQRLHSITWDIAVRRANCFSQVLGIAVTSYLASLSDGGPAWRGHASIWVKHGYLITFEGLLSAVGKELGMIEDASGAISMLRMVNVVLVSDDTNTNAPPNGNASQRIPVPHSPYVRWVHLICLTPNGSHSKTQYRLEIGLDPSYFQSRVPGPLKNGASVRFFPILFQMGVDIRQWGANAGRSVTSQIKDKSKGGGGTADFVDAENAIDDGDAGPGGSLLDDGDEDDDGGVADNEINLALNVEGYRKLNAYAHSVNPTATGATAASAPTPVFDSLEQPQVQPLPPHPCLVSLSEAIKASAGKMEHSVLDRAATACQRFGGGSTVFCKSGKDRTAMQVTFKQAQFAQRFMDKKESGIMLEDTPISYDSVFSKSTLMRKHGNRIPICEKNAGEPKFAFNPLQRKFMPEMLRPEASLCTWSKPET